MKFIFLMICLIFTNCATMSVYDLMFPNVWSISTSKRQVADVAVVEDRKIRIELKSWFFPEYKCFEPYKSTFGFELYAYSVKDCPNSVPIADNVSLDTGFKPNWLPITNENNDVLDLSQIDNRSYYLYTSKLNLFKDIELVEVLYNEKKHIIYLITKYDYCMVLKRNEFGDKIAEYSIESNWEVKKSECLKDVLKNNLVSIPFFKNNKFTIYLKFREGYYSVYTSSKIYSGKENHTYFLHIHSLNERTNYAYVLLFPFALALDIATFPFQILYLYILGSGLPAR